MRPRFLFAAVALFASVGAFAANPVVEQFTTELPVEPTGTVWLDNPYGSIDVMGTDETNKMTLTVQRQITASDEASLHDARMTVLISSEGDSRVRVFRTRYPEPHDPRWAAICNFIVRVPRSINLKVGGKAMDHIRLMQLTG